MVSSQIALIALAMCYEWFVRHFWPTTQLNVNESKHNISTVWTNSYTEFKQTSRQTGECILNAANLTDDDNVASVELLRLEGSKLNSCSKYKHRINTRIQFNPFRSGNTFNVYHYRLCFFSSSFCSWSIKRFKNKMYESIVTSTTTQDPCENSTVETKGVNIYIW